MATVIAVSIFGSLILISLKKDSTAEEVVVRSVSLGRGMAALIDKRNIGSVVVLTIKSSVILTDQPRTWHANWATTFRDPIMQLVSDSDPAGGRCTYQAGAIGQTGMASSSRRQSDTPPPWSVASLTCCDRPRTSTGVPARLPGLSLSRSLSPRPELPARHLRHAVAARRRSKTAARPRRS